MKIEDVAYMSPEEVERRGLAPPHYILMLDDNHSVGGEDREPQQKSDHGNTSYKQDNTMTKVEDFGYLCRMAECADRGCMWCRESMKKNEEVQPSPTAIIEDALQILVRALHGHDDHRFDGVVVDALKALRWSENDAKR